MFDEREGFSVVALSRKFSAKHERMKEFLKDFGIVEDQAIWLVLLFKNESYLPIDELYARLRK